MYRASTSIGLLLLLACGQERSDDPFSSAEGASATEDPSTTLTTSVPTTSTDSGSSESSPTEATVADTSSDDGGPKLDVGAMDTDSTAEGGDCMGQKCSCTSVDLLFVIDNSLSMNDYQVALGQAFPSFADAIIAALPPGTNLHVGVTSTELGYSNVGSTFNCEASGSNGDPQEDFYITPDVTDTGTNGAQGRLYVANGLPYFEIDTDAPPAQVQELRDWFAAAANIGEGGSNIEMSSAAAAWATDPANAATNAGFLRDEGSVLVLFFLQDEPDQSDAPGMSMQQTGAAMLDKIAAAKSACGGLECVVAGGFVDQGCLDENSLGAMFAGLPIPPSTEELPDDDENVDPGYFEPLLTTTLTQVIAQTCDDIGPEG
jgi:hypothetical protein